jgi:hypothetical protein
MAALEVINAAQVGFANSTFGTGYEFQDSDHCGPGGISPMAGEPFAGVFLPR